MTHRSDFLDRIQAAAEDYQKAITGMTTNPQCLDEHDVALALLDVSDMQGWDRLTWTGDPDEYAASYGHDDEGNEFDPVPPESARDFARDLLKDYDVVRKPR